MNGGQRSWFEALSQEHWKTFTLGRTGGASTDLPVCDAPKWITEAFAEFSISDERARDVPQKAICVDANLREMNTYNQ